MKFSIITPAWNSERWFAETIESVLSQEGDFEIEYLIVTDPSPDRTVEIAKEYERKISSGEYPLRCRNIVLRVVERKKGEGMYVAINEGFAQATGDIFAWIAADDLYRPGAFSTMTAVFDAFPNIQWLKGNTATINEHSIETKAGVCHLYYQPWLERGVYGMEAYHVEQDSVFWRAWLWKEGGPFPSHFRSAGDYWLWTSFAKCTRLWNVNADVSCYRKHTGQDGQKNSERLLKQKRESRGGRPLGAWLPRLFFYPYLNGPTFLQPLFVRLYPLLFPFHSRKYIEIEDGKPVQKTMSSFFLE